MAVDPQDALHLRIWAWKPPSLMELLEGLHDRRAARGKRHPLPALLSLAVIAMLAGMTTYAAIVRYGQERGSEQDWRCLLRRPWLKLRASGRRRLAGSSWAYRYASPCDMASASPGHASRTIFQSRWASARSPRSSARAARLRRVRWP